MFNEELVMKVLKTFLINKTSSLPLGKAGFLGTQLTAQCYHP